MALRPPIGTTLIRVLGAGLVLAAGAASLQAETVGYSKDIGPAGAVCDTHAKSSLAWRSCVGAASAKMLDAELFYAGYWLAKTGRYAEALGYLTLAKDKTDRVLTYIGFATRKLGDVDHALPFYEQALALNPDYSVARAYLGEALLTKGEPLKAKVQLAEIETRCGITCAEYADLARHIAAFEAGRG